jgi:hypothetical protein
MHVLHRLFGQARVPAKLVDRRVHWILRFPLLFCWFCRQPRDVCCSMRRCSGLNSTLLSLPALPLIRSVPTIAHRFAASLHPDLPIDVFRFLFLVQPSCVVSYHSLRFGDDIACDIQQQPGRP